MTVPVLGVGGVSTAEDVVKLIMAGATCVGVVGTGILKGVAVFDKLEADLRKWMEDNGVASLDEIRGCAQASMHRPPLYDRKAAVDAEACTGCGLCEKSCYAAAIAMVDKKATVDTGYCSGCGVCGSVCPARAIAVQE